MDNTKKSTYNLKHFRMKIKYMLAPTDLKKFQINYLLTSKSVIISIWAVIIFIIANIAFLYTDVYTRYEWIIRVLYYILIALVMLYIVLRKIQNNKKNSFMFWKYELEVKDDTFHFIKNWYVKKVRIEDYIKYSETKNYIFLYITKTFANIIPKANAKPIKDMEQILEMIKENIPTKFKKKSKKKKS
ncbi:MAG: hypothetical protein ACD_3C00215G0003 [uncultured bacterium (gcode 4)]|uniref:YcxB-like C-terminal domain-containing protein n=1 Tax=uncultured bacterium (gcode 4) TaxID=1234023 RepID=K2GVM4_9BACT|nr:MAG: hypothetical protein ACD_3C00215G0003 [uncultured bacterium (gcode 4)]